MDLCRHQADGEAVDGIKAEGNVGLRRDLVGHCQVGNHRVWIELAVEQAGNGHAFGTGARIVSIPGFLGFVGQVPQRVDDGLVGGVGVQVVMGSCGGKKKAVLK